MKKLLIIFTMLVSFNGFSQIIRTLGNVSNTTDTLKPISNAQRTVNTANTAAMATKAPIASPTFTGTVGGITPTMINLGNLDNTSDVNKPVSTAAATAIGLKQNTLSGTGFVKTIGTTVSYDNSAYLTGITSGNVTTALGFTPYNATNPSAFISSISSANVITALGFTPYNATNPSAFLTSSSASSLYLPLASPLFTGDIEASTLNSGVIVKSPNGTRFRITVSNTGDIVSTSL